MTSPRQIRNNEIRSQITIGQVVDCKIFYKEEDSGFGTTTSTVAKVRCERFENEGLVEGFSGEIISFEDRTDLIQAGDQQFIAFEDVILDNN